jgi:predicted metalloprotease
MLIPALLSCAAIGAGCGSSAASSSSSAATAPAPTTSTSTSTSATHPQEAIVGDELRSLPRAPAATGTAPPPSPSASTVDRSFLQTAFNDAQRFWFQQFRAAGRRYSPAELVIFSSSVHSTGCGPQESVGPFYCPANQTIYLDVAFFDLLAHHAGLGGFAQAYIVGHEFGHHIQHLLGIDRRVAAANQANPAGENARSVRVELQADCLAGAWAHSLYTRSELTTRDLEQKLNTAALIGDDFQARAAGRPADPGLFTHGSSVQRQQWLRTGFESGEPGACDTFSSA